MGKNLEEEEEEEEGGNGGEDTDEDGAEAPTLPNGDGESGGAVDISAAMASVRTWMVQQNFTVGFQKSRES